MNVKPTAYLLAAVATACSQVATAQTFFYVGADGGSFFDLANWNDAADGTGAQPPIDSLPDSTSGAIALDLVIDGSSVLAPGQVDFGVGSLQLIGGGTLEITGSGNDIDFNTATTLTLTDSTLIADGDVVLEGSITISNSVVTALTDDLEIQDNAVFEIADSQLSAGDNLFFETSNGTIINSTFSSADRLGIRAPGGVPADVVFVDSDIDIQGGNGDVDNIFTDNVDSGGSVTLLGTSTLLADTIEEEVDLIIGGTATATLGGNASSIVNAPSTITLTTTGATLVVSEDILFDRRDLIINGLTGLTFNDDPSAWTAPSWNGLDAVSLSLVPEPTAALMATLMAAAVTARLRRP